MNPLPSPITSWIGRGSFPLVMAAVPAALAMPVLYLVGTASPESAQAVARVLAPVLPNVEVRRVEGWGHMAPITHADAVNAEIAAFLRRT